MNNESDFDSSLSSLNRGHGRGRSRLSRATWWITAFVLWGQWNAFTDCFPLNENQARPSWFLYGWPICFATSGRGRFNFGGNFDISSLLFDTIVALLIVVSTVIATETLVRSLPQFSLRSLFAIMFGASLAFAVWSGGAEGFWGLLVDASLPRPDHSELAGDIRPTVRLWPLITWPMTVGILCVGVAGLELSFQLMRRLDHRFR